MGRELILPETSNKTGRRGLYNKDVYVVKVGRDWTEGLLTLAEVCQNYYISQRQQPGPTQHTAFEQYNRCVGTANTALSWQERYEFALESAYILQKIAKDGGMKFDVQVVENATKPEEEDTQKA